jgi:hypothetical protein
VISRMMIGKAFQAAVKHIAAALLASALAGCVTTQALDVRKPTPREEPINSLALEQCIRENGETACQTGNL